MTTKTATPAALEQITNAGITVKPAVVTLGQGESFAEAVKEVASYYDGYVVTAATVSDDRKVLTKLNKFIEAIERKRKDARAEVLAPYDDFKREYDAAMAPVIDTRNQIKEQVNDYDENVKATRLSVIANVFKQLAEASNLDPKNFEQYHADFQNAEHFKKNKFELTTKAIAAINEFFDKEVARLEEITQGREAVRAMAEGNGLIAAPYLTLFDNGQTLPQVLQAITNDYKSAQAEREAQAARKAAEVARLEELRAKAEQEAAGRYSVVDSETGEVMEDVPAEPTPDPIPEVAKQPARLVLDMTFEDVGQIRELKAWLEANGVKYEQKEAVLL
jgi:hypothetical protein